MSIADLAMPFIRMLDAEQAHRLSIRALASGFAPVMRNPPDACLRTTVFGLNFPSPIGLAAGYDKDAEVVGPALKLGFGFVEVGSITPEPQPGNPKPRLFRLSADRAVINRMGFNNAGSIAAARNLARFRASPRHGLVGVNIGKNKDSENAAADYALCSARLARFADYLVINVSSPNTPGLRALQSPDHLRELVKVVHDSAISAGQVVPPILIKIAPDLEDADLRQIATVARDPSVAGLIISNTTITRPDSLRDPQRDEAGGLSGAPLFAPSTEILRRMYDYCAAEVPLIGVGGVASAEDAYAKIRAGASLVQLYSGLVYHGPGLVTRITRGLPALLRADGFHDIRHAVGADHR